MSMIPEVINEYRMYDSGDQFMGITGAVTLPSLDGKTITLTGAGILGDVEDPVVGHFNSITAEIPFLMVTKQAVKTMNPLERKTYTLRASVQDVDKSTGAVAYHGIRIVYKGKTKSFTPGTLETAAQMNGTMTMELTYFLLEIDGDTMLEIDKLNSVYKVNGKDILEKSRSLC